MTREVSVLHDNRAPVVDDGNFTRRLQSTTRGYQYFKFIDGRLTADGIPEPAGKQYLVPKIVQTGRMFHKDGGPPETCPPELVDEMNSRISKEDWPLDLNNNPTEPFKVYEDVYLVDLRDGSSSILSNCTVGQGIAAEKLRSQVEAMRALRGMNALPVVVIESVLMKTRFGSKARPSFKVVRWEGLGPERTASEIVNDRLPWDDPIPDDL